MTHRSIRVQDDSLRFLRLNKGITQAQLAKDARLSENSVANAEKGRSVSIRTVRELIRALNVSAELLCVDDERGLYTVTMNSSPPQGHEILRFLSKELDGASSAEAFKAKLEMLLKLAGVKEAFISELFEGSLHWSMNLPHEASVALRRLFETNEAGELVVDAESVDYAIEG